MTDLITNLCSIRLQQRDTPDLLHPSVFESWIIKAETRLKRLRDQKPLPETPEFEENKTLMIDGFPFRKVSIQHGPEDALRYKAYLQRKGYWVRIRRKQNKQKTRRNYYMYAYHPVRDAVQQVQEVTA